MSAINLLFERPAPASPHLVFGETGVEAVPVEFTLHATLPALGFVAHVVPLVDASLAATLPALGFVAEAEYRSNTQRPTVGQTRSPQQNAQQHLTGNALPHQNSGHSPSGWEAFWHKVTGQPAGIEHHLPQVLNALPVRTQQQFQDATPAGTQAGFVHQQATRAALRQSGLFQDAQGVQPGTLFLYQDGSKTPHLRTGTFQQGRGEALLLAGMGFQRATELRAGWWQAFQDGRPPPPGIFVPVPPAPEVCYLPTAHLLFEVHGPASPHLVFFCEGRAPQPDPQQTIVVPIQRVYIVINNLALRRTSDNAIVPAFGMSLSLDVGSWTWGFSASLPAQAQALVEPQSQPVELSAWVNGTEFRVLAEQVSRERSFGQSSIRISGRGRNAALDAPYSPVQVFGNANSRTHQQLFDDVLTFNGVPLGYVIDYGLEPWSIPAGVWNHSGTYISALSALAQAAGAYLVPHPSALRFKVRHRYPINPWAWDTALPDFELPSAAITREGLAWKEKPAYNRVFVSGTEQGVLGRVTRTGTAGELLAPMVTDALITTAAAARQRGRAVLGDTGRKVEHTLRLPVLAATGILEPGTMVSYVDEGRARKGLVRSTQVEAQMPDVWQTLGVEVHENA